MKVLQFSGGIDSLATLFVKQPEWEDITVMWCDTGAAYPEIRELTKRVSRLVPHFRIIHSDKDKWEQQNGIAVDLVPERATLLGSLIHGEPPQMFTSFLRCCSANIWEPLERAARAAGATHIIRGQRRDDERKAPIHNGHIDPLGIIYELPIEDWSRADVFAYCKKTCPGWIQEGYGVGEKTGRDCWDCIAYLDHNRQRIKNLPFDRREVVMRRLSAYAAAIAPEYSWLQRTLS